MQRGSATSELENPLESNTGSCQAKWTGPCYTLEEDCTLDWEVTYTQEPVRAFGWSLSTPLRAKSDLTC
jgi:hypothetical protein